jgi:hypothetical protein
MDRGDDGLRGGLDPGEQVGEARLFRGAAEFGHVGARGEGAARGEDDHGVDPGIGGGAVEALGESGADGVRQRVHRRVVDGQQSHALRDAVVHLVAHSAPKPVAFRPRPVVVMTPDNATTRSGCGTGPDRAPAAQLLQRDGAGKALPPHLLERAREAEKEQFAPGGAAVIGPGVRIVVHRKPPFR